MNSEELNVNIAVLEHLGWFVGEVETDEFDALIECCRPDGSVLEQVPVTPFLLSLYDEEEGGLEERLWFFAPHCSTSLETIVRIIEDLPEAYSWEVARNWFEDEDAWYYSAKVVWLCWDDDGYMHDSHYETAWVQKQAAIALCKAYLRCEGIEI